MHNCIYLYDCMIKKCCLLSSIIEYCILKYKAIFYRAETSTSIQDIILYVCTYEYARI